jgi:excinuclease ABC subunit C
LRERVRAECANKPGVYRMLGPTGLVLYVGQSRVLRTRLLSYFRASGRRDKAARILRHAFSIEWEYTNSEFGALLRELRLIKQHRPQFNSMLVTDDWPHAYIALTGGAVPGLRVVPRSDEPSAVALFGPFRKVSMVREAVRALSEACGLRDCSLDEASPGAKTATVWFASEPTTNTVLRLPARKRAPGCLRHDLGTCDGPCIGYGDGVAYRQRVEVVRAFLEGKSDAPVNELASAMERAAAALEFERAAVLRDRLERIRWLQQRVQHFRANVDRLTFRYHARGTDDSEWVYLVRRGTVRAEVPHPTNEESRAQLEALAHRVYEGADPSGADIPSHDLDEFYLVASWFRRRPDERDRTYAAVSA